MDRIAEIAKEINSQIVSGLGITSFKAYPIAEKVIIGEKTVYFDKQANKVQETVMIDDSDGITLFHIIRSISTETNFELGMGGNPYVTDTYQMSLIVFDSNKDNTRSGRALLQAIEPLVPTSIEKQKRVELGINRFWLRATSIDPDKHAVWEAVFSGVKNNLSDDSILIKIEYEAFIGTYRNCAPVACLTEV